MTNATLRGKPDAGNPHVRFDEGEVASAKPRRGSLLYKKLLMAVVAAVAAVAGFGGNTLNVPSKYSTIEAAISAAGSGDEIVLAKSGSPYSLAANLTLPSGVTLRGETGNRDDVVVKPGGYVIYLSNANAVLADLTVSDASASGDYPKMGVIQVTHTSAVCVNCRVTNCNIANSNGRGAIRMANGTVTNCLVDANYSNAGRVHSVGVRVDGGMLVNTVIKENYYSNFAGGYADGTLRGGALIMGGGKAVNCQVSDNQLGPFTDDTTLPEGRHFASGVQLMGSAQLINCTVIGNTYDGVATERVLGVSVDGANAKVQNCVILANGNSSGTIMNIVPSAAFDHCAVDASAASNCTASVGTSLAAAMTRDAASGIFVPGIGSPLIDAGSEQAGIQDGLDVLGNARLSGAAIDIGAAEHAASGALACQIDASATEGVDSLTATLTATAEGDTNGLAYYWDTDGDTSTWEVSGADKASIQLEFGIGSHPVTLKVTNGQGEEATASKTFTVSQSTYYVDIDSANPLSPYGTAATAATNLADVLSLAGAGTTVRVAPGAYAYAAATNLAVPAGVSVVGASGNRGDVVFSKARFVLNANAAVIGVTIADAWTSESYGGGVRMSTGSRLQDCAVRNCVSGDWNARGCGVYNDGGVVSNCVVSGCHATLSRCMATGVYQKNGGQLLNCVITHCTMSGGTTSVYTDAQPRPAAAVFLDGGSMANCYVADNSMGKFSAADSGFDLGSGVYAAGSSTRVVNTLVYQNTYASNVSSRVYGIVVTNGATVVNTAVFNNGHVDGTLANLPPSESFDHCATDATAAKGCRDSVGATMAAAYRTDPASGLWRPQVVGPLVNAGLTQADLESGLDLAGNPRLHGEAIDIGAFECPGIPGLILILR
jgi:hypothetical protein